MKKFTLLTGLAALATVGAVFAVYVENKLTVGDYDSKNDIIAGFHADIELPHDDPEPQAQMIGSLGVEFAPYAKSEIDYNYGLSKEGNSVVYQDGGRFGIYQLTFTGDKNEEIGKRTFDVEIHYLLSFEPIDEHKACLTNLHFNKDNGKEMVDTQFAVSVSKPLKMSATYTFDFGNPESSENGAEGKLEVKCIPGQGLWDGVQDLVLLEPEFPFEEESQLDTFVAAMENTQAVMTTEEIIITDTSDSDLTAHWQRSAMPEPSPEGEKK